MNSLMHCPIQQLRDYLNESLDETMHPALFEHLEHCETCRRRIEDDAGSADDWEFVRTALADADISVAKESTEAHSINSTAQLAEPFQLLQFLSPSDDPRAAGRIGPFEITGIVGSGGMGVVLKARDPALDRFVAVKILAPHLASSLTARKRFAREARAAAAVIHDNVIAIYQVSEWNQLPYLVMPYLPDPSLQQRIDKHGCLDLEATVSIGLQVARGLSAAHCQGLVHRDVKPANVLLSKGTERAIITDFGLARAADDASLTRTGMLTGTPHYMSPEQARGEVVDQKSDLYSLGSLLFAMLVGQPPINHEIGSETIDLIATGRLPSLNSAAPGAPPWLVQLVDWLHQPRRQDRPESAEFVAELLEQCLAHLRQPLTQSLPKCLTLETKVDWKNYRRPAGATICLAAVTLVIAIAVSPGSPSGASSNPELPNAGHLAFPGNGSAPTVGDAPTSPIEGNSSMDVATQWELPESRLHDLQFEMQTVESRILSPWDRQPSAIAPINSDLIHPTESKP